MAFHLRLTKEEDLRSLREAVIGHWSRVGLLLSKKKQVEVKSPKGAQDLSALLTIAYFSLSARGRRFRLMTVYAVDKTSASPVVTCVVTSHMLCGNNRTPVPALLPSPPSTPLPPTVFRSINNTSLT